MNHMRKQTCKIAAFCISTILLLGQLSAVCAADRSVMIQPSGSGASAAGEGDSAAVAVSGLRITDVDAPVPGVPLDTSAAVTSVEGVQWEIPVMWVDDAGTVAEGTAEDRLYFPVLVFFVPEGYTVLGGDSETGAFPVCIDDSLSELFGQDLLTVWLAELQITLIFPGTASLEAVLSRLSGMHYPSQQSTGVTASMAQAAAALTAVPATEDPDNGQIDLGTPAGLVDVYCSQTARDRLDTDQLERLIDLIINRLQPQAVELLLSKFPLFRYAADRGGVGREIGLYVFYEKGDNDGRPEHMDTSGGSVAYVRAEHVPDGDTIKFQYLLGVDAAALCRFDEESGWKAILMLEDGKIASLLENTIVHEMMHAFCYDILRAGMCGAVRPEELFNNNSEEQTKLYNATLFPAWFTEGMASAVENVYQYRRDMFQLLRYDSSLSGKTAGFSGQGILKAYLTEDFPGDPETGMLTYDLQNVGLDEDSLREGLSNTPAKYVSGYLACLYLSELAAHESKTYSAAEHPIRSKDLLYGLNHILECLQEGQTLDDVINNISGGRYTDTDDFEKKFIKGESTGNGADQVWQGDADSLLFCSDFLNYMLSIDNNESFENYANGSILFNFDRDYKSPLDPDKETSTDVYIIAESNELVESTVPAEVAMAGGGKSRSGAYSVSVSGTASGAPLPPAVVAAKEAGIQTAKEDAAQAGEEADGTAAQEAAVQEAAVQEAAAQEAAAQETSEVTGSEASETVGAEAAEMTGFEASETAGSEAAETVGSEAAETAGAEMTGSEAAEMTGAESTDTAGEEGSTMIPAPAEQNSAEQSAAEEAASGEAPAEN